MRSTTFNPDTVRRVIINLNVWFSSKRMWRDRWMSCTLWEISVWKGSFLSCNGCLNGVEVPPETRKRMLRQNSTLVMFKLASQSKKLITYWIKENMDREGKSQSKQDLSIWLTNQIMKRYQVTSSRQRLLFCRALNSWEEEQKLKTLVVITLLSMIHPRV